MKWQRTKSIIGYLNKQGISTVKSPSPTYIIKFNSSVCYVNRLIKLNRRFEISHYHLRIILRYFLYTIGNKSER